MGNPDTYVSESQAESHSQRIRINASMSLTGVVSRRIWLDHISKRSPVGATRLPRRPNETIVYGD